MLYIKNLIPRVNKFHFLKEAEAVVSVLNIHELLCFCSGLEKNP
jgi:hypothetical protein